MSKFEELVKIKYQQLNEAVPTATGTTSNVAQQTAGAVAPAPQTAQAPTESQPNPQAQGQGPETHLVNAFKNIAWAQPQKAIQAFNTALKNVGNVPGMSQFFQNIGYDPTQGFVYNPQAAAPAATGQGQQIGTPGATATNTR